MIGDTEDQLAKSVGNGLWKLRGKLLTSEELDRQLAADAVEHDDGYYMSSQQGFSDDCVSAVGSDLRRDTPAVKWRP